MVEGEKPLVYCKKEITAEQYKRAMWNNGFIAECDKPDIFTDAELHGYGVYLAKAYADGGKYICSYRRGESCD